MGVAFLISFIGHGLFIGILELGLFLFPEARDVNYITINFEMEEPTTDVLGGDQQTKRIDEKPKQPTLKKQSDAGKIITQNIFSKRIENKVDKINQEDDESTFFSDTIDKQKRNHEVEENPNPSGFDQQHNPKEMATRDFSKNQEKEINAGLKEVSNYQKGTEQDIKTSNSSGGGISEGKSGLSGSEKEAIARYQDIVRQRIEQVKMYPLWAKKQGIEGITLICFTVLSDGTGHSVKIVRSSGSNILDEEAVSTIKRASPFPPVPKIMSGKLVRIELSIIFSLKKN